MLKQYQISKHLNIDETLVSRLLNGKRKVSWPLAQQLSDIFPGKTIQQWKEATPQELKQAFSQLKGAA